MKKETLLERLKRFLGSIGWKLFIWGNDFTQEEYWERIYRQEKEYKQDINAEYSEQEIAQLQSEVHKITGDGKVMMLFNELLGVNAN